jgi:DNA-directed RNA polymerase
MTTLEKLVSDIELRQKTLRADKHIHTHYLKDVDPKELISLSYIHILRGLERFSTLVEIVAIIGRKVRQKLSLPNDSAADAQVGWFICISYIECKVLKYRLKFTYKNGKRSKYPSYFFVTKDWNAIKELWSLVDTTKLDIFPMRECPPDWVGPINEFGMTIIKKGHPSQLKKFNKNNTQMLFDVLNKLQKIGWRINKDVFEVYTHFLHKESSPNPFKLHLEEDEEKKQSLLIEANAIENLALKNLDNCFYHSYNFDFRGRIYCNTAFLHEQSSDNSKGLLMLDKGTPLGKEGLFFLKVHISNSFGNDKVSLEDRAQFVNDHIDTFLLYAEKPTINMGWIEAENPFSFLASCIELKKVKDWIVAGNDPSDYVCHLPIYIDGSCNGMQHLVAMSLDETIAPLVNLIPQDVPGDLYMYVAKSVWAKLQELADKLTPEEKAQFKPIMDKARELQLIYKNAPDKSEQKSLAYANVQEWRNKNRLIREKIFPLYWLEITNPKDQRKICKRNTMTLAYGGTPYGFGQQLIEDTKDMSDYLRDKEHLHAALLGHLVFETCYEMLPGPGKLLRMFETLAERSNEQDVFLKWTAPVTNFPVVQAYRKPTTVRTRLKYGDEELKVNLQTWDEAVINKDSQKTGAAPNLVHSFDAAHLSMVVHSADFNITVVHDSFGATPGDMPKLFKLVREKFVDFYNVAPLETVLVELESLDLLPSKGNLDLKRILESDFAFC